MGEWAVGRLLDKGVHGDRLSVNTEVEFSGGNRYGEVQKVDLGSSYFSREFYRQIDRVYELKELTDLINGTNPIINDVIDISPLKGNIYDGDGGWSDWKISVSPEMVESRCSLRYLASLVSGTLAP